MNKVFENCDFCSIQSFLFYLNFLIELFPYLIVNSTFLFINEKNKNFMALFYGWGSTVSRLHSHY